MLNENKSYEEVIFSSDDFIHEVIDYLSINKHIFNYHKIILVAIRNNS